ncbi:MAG: helix-turn-helix domain-containing protein [Oscillospiraceae bacterium]|nr:helix-turn-helix domain-containing protein [Oscillospiraceae bacterium]
MTVGERIKFRRKQLGITADTLAEKVGVSRSTVFRWEKGDIEKVPGDTLVPIANALSVTPAYLMGWEEPSPALSFNLTPTEADLVQTFRSLNPLGQEEALDHLHHLSEKDAFKKEGPSPRSLPAVR